MNTFTAKAAVGTAVLAFTLGAAAQSSVTLSGQIGVGMNSRDHYGPSNGQLHDLSDHLLNASFLRVSGNEDLGDGMRALFVLESGLNPDTGTTASAAKFWNRQSWVGLQMGTAGTLTAGRQFHASTERAIRTLDVNNLAGPTGLATPIAAFGVSRYAGNDTRSDNTVKYRFSRPGLMEFGASVSAGEGGPYGKSYAVDGAYTTSDVNVGATFAHYEGATQAGGRTPVETIYAAGGSVNLGNFRPYLAYYDNKIDSAAGTTVAGGGTQHNRILALGLAAQYTAQVRMTAAWYHDKGTTMNGVAGRDGNKDTGVLSFFYAFSKRTEAYASVYTNRYTDGYRLDPFNYAAFAPRNAASSSFAGQSVGLQHRF